MASLSIKLFATKASVLLTKNPFVIFQSTDNNIYIYIYIYIMHVNLVMYTYIQRSVSHLNKDKNLLLTKLPINV